MSTEVTRSREFIQSTAKAWHVSYQETEAIFAWVDKLPPWRRSKALTTVLRREWDGRQQKKAVKQILQPKPQVKQPRPQYRQQTPRQMELLTRQWLKDQHTPKKAKRRKAKRRVRT